MAAANGRLTKELAEVGKDDKTSGVKAVPKSSGNIRSLRGTIQGPLGTCYEGGVFEVDIEIPAQYPFEPPKMKFTTKVSREVSTEAPFNMEYELISSSFLL